MGRCMINTFYYVPYPMLLTSADMVTYDTIQRISDTNRIGVSNGTRIVFICVSNNMVLPKQDIDTI